MGRFSRLVPVVAVLLLCCPSPATSGELPITLGEVSTSSASRGPQDVEALRSIASEAVESIETATLPAGAPAIVSVSLVRMDARPAASSDPSPSTEVSCLVSATLRDRRRGAIFAVLEGSARGRGEPGRVRALEQATMRAAVRGAIARVPEAMQQRRK